jgi:hypothetical protein
MKNGFDYTVSCEVAGGERIRVNKQAYGISELIRSVRKTEPTAHMFIVIKKTPLTQEYSPIRETHPSYPQP